MFATKLEEYGKRLREEGREEGKSEGKTEAAKKMLQKGYALEDIIEITGLSEEEVKKWERE